MKSQTVLVVEDNEIALKMVRLTLESAGYRVLEAETGHAALALMTDRPDLILQDLRLPDMDGFELVQGLRRHPGGADVPIIAFSGFLSKLEEARALGIGFTDHLSKPAEPSRILEMVETYLPRGNGDRRVGAGRRLLLVDDDPLQRRLAAKRLEQAGFVITEAESGAEAHAHARRSRPDLIVSDVLMPDLDGFQFCLDIRVDPELAHVPVVLYSTAYSEGSDRSLARAVGASDLVPKTPDCSGLIDAADAALRKAPPPVAEDGRTRAAQYIARVLQQLDRQIVTNASLKQRLALRATELGILGGVADALKSGSTVEEVLNTLLYRTLDAAGASVGAVYLRAADGALSLAGDLGWPAGSAEALRGFFGRMDLLSHTVESRDPAVVPSAPMLGPLAEAIDRRAVHSLLLAPLLTGEVCSGVIVMASGSRDFTDDWLAFGRSIGSQFGLVISLSRALADLRASEKQFHDLFERVPVGLYRTTPDGQIVDANAAMVEMLAYPDQAALRAANMTTAYAEPADREHLRSQLERDGVVRDFEARLVRRDGTVIWTQDTTRAVRDEAGVVRSYEGALKEITEQKRAEEEIQRQMDRLASLRTVDMAISSSLDLRVTLGVLLDQVTSQLGAPAADVLLLDPHTQTLHHAAARGFRTPPRAGVAVRLGEGHAGRAARDSRIVAVPDLQRNPGAPARAPMLRREGFVAYVAAPLVAKGQVKGVLEVFHRERPAAAGADQAELEFLEALAGQAAIAIDNAVLFSDLQRSNLNLVLAYDTTLEGWSRALDLRDNETEGHTQRVTEMALTVARAMGVGDDELVHIRRGALLHDIGKMGIPDAVLLKPGPLTDEEWVVMRRHPVYANDLLAPIEYLRPAVKIPYCHHEKWDGTGYPQGLRGEQIPLSARIFSVADVWDALRSDRPYRPAWPEERVREHIRAEAGRHFDPSVVEVFLRLLDEASSTV